MIAESLFNESPLDFCILMQAMEEQYANVPLYIIYFHQFALNGEADVRQGDNTFVYHIDPYTAEIFPELEGYYKVEITLDDEKYVEAYELYENVYEL